MMKDWARKRKISLVVHVAFVSVPFLASTASAIHFWNTLSGNLLLAIGMMLVVEILALTGLVLYIYRIKSPFTVLRHALPFISIVPLGWELFQLLSKQEGNSEAVVWTATVVVTVIFVFVSWRCFTTIEGLFVNTIEAAKEKAQEETQALQVWVAKQQETVGIVDAFVADYTSLKQQGTSLAVVTPVPMPQPQLDDTPAKDNTDDAVTMPQLTDKPARSKLSDDEKRAVVAEIDNSDLPRLEAVREAAQKTGSSERSVYRWIEMYGEA